MQTFIEFMRISLVTFLCFLAVAVANVNAQVSRSVCTINRNAPPSNTYYWPPHSTVKVYFVRSMFTVEQRQTLSAAMADWTEATKKVGANVNFVDAGEADSVTNCRGCLTITRRDVYRHDRKHYAFFYPLRRDRNGLLVSAWIDFDFAITGVKALRGFMSHELGHGMGLWDCESCDTKQTIMNGFPGINRDNGLTSPSRCDLEVVRQVYQLNQRSPSISDNSSLSASAGR
jgi:hypothetical protein